MKPPAGQRKPVVSTGSYVCPWYRSPDFQTALDGLSTVLLALGAPLCSVPIRSLKKVLIEAIVCSLFFLKAFLPDMGPLVTPLAVASARAAAFWCG